MDEMDSPDWPEFPYHCGRVLQLIESRPPAPFGEGGYGPGGRRYGDEVWRNPKPRVQQVLDFPPEETRWPSKDPPRTAVLTVTKTICVGESRPGGAQIIVCNVHIHGEPHPRTVAAKIYDPLYYPAFRTDPPVMWAADKDYSREASAYEYMQTQTAKARQKPGFAPKYYGSWTFNLALNQQGKTHKRWVRLILMEHIDGSSMKSLYTYNSQQEGADPDCFHYDEALRLGVLAELLEGVVKQFHAGLDQHDLAPRNVMLVSRQPVSSIPRVVLIDYNIARVWPYTKGGPKWYQEPNLPVSPAVVYSDGPPYHFQGWAPPDFYLEDSQRYKKWLQVTFGGQHAARFAPITSE
ncbi:hypothetical protein F4808DRAFT_445172 [Astrocystis sublimbata]|nr:hypothetical protein F4808DRAFT_445172 [Astrocystis sublimbata]